MPWVLLFLLGVSMLSHVASQERCMTSAVSYTPFVAPYTLALLSTTPPTVLASKVFSYSYECMNETTFASYPSAINDKPMQLTFPRGAYLENVTCAELTVEPNASVVVMGFPTNRTVEGGGAQGEYTLTCGFTRMPIVLALVQTSKRRNNSLIATSIPVSQVFTASDGFPWWGVLIIVVVGCGIVALVAFAVKGRCYPTKTVDVVVHPSTQPNEPY